MKLSVSSVIPQNPVFLWLWITLLVWWSGLAGRDFIFGACSYICGYLYLSDLEQATFYYYYKVDQ